MGQTNDDELLRALHERMAVLEHELAEVRSVAAQLTSAPAASPEGVAPATATTAAPAAAPSRTASMTASPTASTTEALGKSAGDAGNARSDRRQLLRRVGTAAAGAVAGSAALAVSQASPAAANDGDFLKIGAANTGAATTQLDNSLFLVGNDTTAIIGQTTGAGFNSRGVYGSASGSGVGVLASSIDGAPLHISNGTQVIPPQAGTWVVGQFLIAGSHLFYCYSGGPGPQSKWARLSATFVPLAAPARVYDSRPNATPLAVVKGKLADHAERVIDPKLGGAVPQGASAVVMNLTATDTNPGGFLSAFKNGVAWPGTSSVNWFQPGSTVANQCTVALDGTAQFKVRCEGAGGTHFVVDVVGYYL
jgi:hypothetical protein